MNHRGNTIVNEYLDWLKGLVGGPDPFSDALFWTSFETHFKWLVSNDMDRAYDGLELRDVYPHSEQIWGVLGHSDGCRMLEFLIGLSIRMNSAIYDYKNPDLIGVYFRELLSNLGLDEADKLPYVDRIMAMQDIFRIVNERDYDHTGSGGLFPIPHPKQDQREVEIWYQMQEYLALRL